MAPGRLEGSIELSTIAKPRVGFCIKKLDRHADHVFAVPIGCLPSPFIVSRFAEIRSSQELMTKMRFTGLQKLTGACLSPMDAYLVLRGLKTLALRMDAHCANAQRVAEALSTCPEVADVYYPGLPSHPQFPLAKRQMSGAGGMIAFELKGGLAAGRSFMNHLKLVKRAVSLGDAETLAQHPASMTHSTYTPEERQRHLISDGLIRLSVGLEDFDDIWNDIEAAIHAGTSATQ